MSRWLGITLGDPTGVGVEVTLKALARLEEDDFKFLLLGDAGLLQRTNQQLALGLSIEPFEDAANSSGRFFFAQAGSVLSPTVPQGSIPRRRISNGSPDRGGRTLPQGRIGRNHHRAS